MSSYFQYIQKVGSGWIRLDQPIGVPHSDAISVDEPDDEVGSRVDQPAADPWATVPRNMRSIVRAYVNSNRSRDRDRANDLCAAYSLDYVSLRAMIREEIRARLHEQIEDAL